MYQQTLYKVVKPIKINTIKRLNKSKKWEYGYNKEHDIVVISKTGQIGEIYEIQNFQVALPKQPKKIHKFNSSINIIKILFINIFYTLPFIRNHKNKINISKINNLITTKLII